VVTPYLYYNGSDHGCSTLYAQCYWNSLATAKYYCAQWSECEALYCSDKHNAGAYVCYARKYGEVAALWNTVGDTSYIKTSPVTVGVTTCSETNAQSSSTVQIKLASTGIWETVTKSSSPGGYAETTIDGVSTRWVTDASTGYEQFAMKTSTSDGWCVSNIKLNGVTVFTGTVWLDSPCDGGYVGVCAGQYMDCENGACVSGTDVPMSA
jgi:hypothetical protein